jgi:hypothetical protein
MSLDRYDIEECDGEGGSCHAKLVIHKRGDYVLFDDVETLINEILTSMQSVIDNINV